MSKLLAIFFATGQQGGSIISSVLSNDVLSKEFKIRAITRDPSLDKSLKLAKMGVEVVKADSSDVESLKIALTGVHTVFAAVASTFTVSGEVEISQGRNIADVCVANGVKRIVFSTLPGATDITEGKITTVSPFDATYSVGKYIESLPISHSFYSPGVFMQNFLTGFKPLLSEDGETYVIRHIINGDSKALPLLDVESDTGKFVTPLLLNPKKYEGKTLAAAHAIYSFNEAAGIFSKVYGKKIIYQQISEEQLASQLPSPILEIFVGMLRFYEAYGYFGVKTEEEVRWGLAQIKETTISLEEYARNTNIL